MRLLARLHPLLIVTVLLVAAFIGIVDQILNRAVGLIFH